MAGTPASLVMGPGWPGVVGVSGGRFNLANYLASVSGSYWDFTNLSTLSQDNLGATPVTTIGDPIGRVVDTINARNAIQGTGTLKPTLQTTGAKFDASDDNLLTSYLAGSGANFIVALVTVPATIGSFQYFFGADVSNARIGIGVNTDGTTGFAIGAISPTISKGSTDIRNSEVVAGVSCNGAQVLGFVGNAPEYSNAQSGSPTTVVPLRVGSHNANGTATAFFGGSIKKLVAGREFLTLSRYNQIRNALLAA